MFQKYFRMLLPVLLAVAPIPALSQAAPSATQGGWPLSIGAGYSNFDTDWSGRLGGGDIWVDWSFYGAPSLLHNLGVEVEARDLNCNRTGVDPSLRMDTAAGGPIYKWRHYHNAHPYVKMLFGFGRVDFSEVSVGIPGYTHDSRTVIAPAAGLDYRAYKSIWVRANYEYQFWPDMFNNHALNPNGFTIGASYDFHRR